MLWNYIVRCMFQLCVTLHVRMDYVWNQVFVSVTLTLTVTAVTKSLVSKWYS